METIAEKECSALGGLFQLIVNDLKVGPPVWEDFLGKAAKLHSHLKTTVFALTAFLDAFQKIADLATGARGATKDIGTALTRLCLRHRSVEAKLKIFSSTIMDHLVIPLQERLEEWKKIAYQMDKDHAKEYKRVRQEIKKKSSDTLRLQKKVRKTGKGETKKTLDTTIQDVNNKYHLLEETEKNALRRALIEERGRYCLFVSCLRPVVESELATVHEVSHLQEVLDALVKLTENPHVLPSASEQVIADVKSTDSVWSFQTPPGSPTSLGSRKSSVCSISSLNSSSGESCKSYSPSHHRSRSLSHQLPSGALRLLSVSSQDSGFTSQDTLFTRLPTPPALEVINQPADFSIQAHATGDIAGCGGASSPSFPPLPVATGTWPNLQDAEQFERAAASVAKSQRPHTISSTYEHHVRPPLTTQTFQPLQTDIASRSDIGDSAGTLISDCSEVAGELQEEHSDIEEYSDDVTPTHKPCTPPLLPRSAYLKWAKPKVPQKSAHLRQYCANVFTHVRISCNSSEPLYANSTDVHGRSIQHPAETSSIDSSTEHQDKASFRNDLAAAIAQKALQQRLSSPNLNYNQLPPLQSHLTSDQTPTTKATPPIPPKIGVVLEKRTLPSPGQAPAVPPHKPVTTEHASRKPNFISEKETSWNVFNDSSDSGAAHAQLMQALNARLNVLQQQADEHSQRQQRQTDTRRFSVVETSSIEQASSEVSSTVTITAPRRPTSANPIRKPRAHSIAGTDREAFLNTLNSKFAEMQQQEQSSLQTTPKKRNVTALPSESSASNDSSTQRAIARERQALQCIAQNTQTCPRTSNYETTHTFDSSTSGIVKTPNASYQGSLRQERRLSLNLAGESGGQIQTFFSPMASSNLHDDRSPQQGDGLDSSCGMMTDAAARVHTWLSGRGSMDMSQCRMSLLGQIRQGINLRKAHTNDRSAPFFKS